MPINTEFFKFCAHLLKKQKFTISSQYEYFSVKNGCYDIVTIKKEVKKLKNTKSAVLACVTSQYNCDRIIRIAKEIADSSDCELRVMSVLKPMSDYSSVSDEIEYLYLIAKESGADMTVMFSDDAPKVTAEFVRDNNVERIVTGMHDGKDNSFLVKFNELSPTTPITMVSKDNMVYSMDLCRSYS